MWYAVRMVFRFGESDVRWIDLEHPTADEVREVADELGFGGRIVEELLSPTPFPRVLHEEETLLLVLHFPAERTVQEVDFVVGKHFVLTVRYEVVAPIHELRKMLETNALTHFREPVAVEALLELLFNHLFMNIRDYATSAGKRLERIERDMFTDKEGVTIQAISEISRVFLHLEAAVANHEAPLELFLHELEEHAFFNDAFTTRVNRILAEHAQTLHLIEALRAVATEIRETNAGLLNARQNEIMKVLTIMAFVTFPLSLIASILGMNTDYLPIVGLPHDFWIIMGIMFSFTICFFIFFRIKHWI